MIVSTSTKRAVSALAVCAALVLPACSSSGGTGGSQEVTAQQIAAKLKTDSTVTALKSRLGSQADKFDTVVDCVADAMHKDIKQSELKAYVNGDKKITELSGSTDKITSDTTACVKKAVGAS